MCNASNHRPDCTCGWGGDGHTGRRSNSINSATRDKLLLIASAYDEYQSRRAEYEERKANYDERMRKQRQFQHLELAEAIFRYSQPKLRPKKGKLTKRSSKKIKVSQNKSGNKLKNTSAAYRKGNCETIKTAILLSAPGEVEEKTGRPAAGRTGTTLQKALKHLNVHCGSDFPSPNLDDYTIINSVEKVHYKKKTGSTEGKDSEVREPNNIARLQSLLSETNCVLALGDKAQLAISECGFSGKVYQAPHPSAQALNKCYQSKKETPSERNFDRIFQWAGDILGQNLFLLNK